MTAAPQLLHVGFTCRDLDQTAQFYVDHLGFSRGASWQIEGSRYGAVLGLPQATLKLLRLQLGAECLELMQVLDPGQGQRQGRPIPADSRSCDLWFQHICLVSRDLDAALSRLQPALQSGQAQAVSSAVQTLPQWNTAAAGIRAFKFRDPEGHNLELLQFPPDKGDARWHLASGSARGSASGTPAERPVILGIDHSAISIANTEASCRFYDQLLGLRLGGDGINSGPTQDGLDGLNDTQVRITSHRCTAGAGIECLHYLPPNGGRAMPPDLAAQDLAHWQIRLQLDDLNAVVDQIASFGGRLLSPSPVDLGDEGEALGFCRALQVADPDGHRLQLVQTA